MCVLIWSPSPYATRLPLPRLFPALHGSSPHSAWPRNPVPDDPPMRMLLHSGLWHHTLGSFPTHMSLLTSVSGTLSWTIQLSTPQSLLAYLLTLLHPMSYLLDLLLNCWRRRGRERENNSLDFKIKCQTYKIFKWLSMLLKKDEVYSWKVFFFCISYKKSAWWRLRRLSFVQKFNFNTWNKKALINSLKLVELSDQYNFYQGWSFRTFFSSFGQDSLNHPLFVVVSTITFSFVTENRSWILWSQKICFSVPSMLMLLSNIFWRR